MIRRLLGRFVCRFWFCRLTCRAEWREGEFIGWTDYCERCGESQFRGCRP